MKQPDPADTAPGRIAAKSPLPHSPKEEAAAHERRTIAKGDKVPFWTKVAYGVGGPVEHLAVAFPKSLFTPVFNIGLGMSPALIGIVLMLMRLWDALLDPVMGNISDNARTRWGRRRPFIVIGAVLTGLVMPALWLVPEGLSEMGMFSWFLITGLLLYTCFTVWAMPYYSLNLEITPDYDERTRVVAYRAFFQHVFYLAGGWILYLATLPVFHDPVTGEPNPAIGMRTIGFVMGGLIIVLGVIPGIFVKERYYQKDAKKQPKTPLIKGLKQTLATKPFRILLAVIALKIFGSQAVSTLGFYLNAYYVCEGDLQLAAQIQGLKGTALFLPGLLAIPLFTWLSERFSKVLVAQITIIGGILADISIPFFYTPDYPYLQIVPQILISPLAAAIWMLMPSMQADIADYDELQNGTRREGSFASVFSWIVKLSFTLTTGLGGFVLVWTGFDIKFGANQPEHVLSNLMWVYVGTQIVFYALAGLLLMKYPLSRERMADIRNQLEARRGKI